MKVIIANGPTQELELPMPEEITEIENSLDVMFTAFMEHDLSSDKTLRTNVNCDINQLRLFFKQIKMLQPD